jgi:hypothetical protein
MAKWWENIRKRKSSKNGNRFYTQLDMAEIKRMTSVANSQANRGEIEHKPNYTCECGCGAEGCFLVVHVPNDAVGTNYRKKA